jgi:hypothetical protein
MQALIVRSPFVMYLDATGDFNVATDNAVRDFEKGNGLTVDGIFGPKCAQSLLYLHAADNWHDNGTTAGALGFKYKFHLPVHRNRSIETTATLYNSTGGVLHTFPARAHGYDYFHQKSNWPDFNSTGYGLNEFSSCGNTVTGLSAIDLNSPEDDPKLYGPYNINRIVWGIEGNARFLLKEPSPIRTGLLVHTGEWPGWTPDEPMPNSAGCVHLHPEDVKAISEILQSIGVEVRTNPGHGGPYAYKPQGLIAVEQID